MQCEESLKYKLFLWRTMIREILDWSRYLAKKLKTRFRILSPDFGLIFLKKKRTLRLTTYAFEC